MNINFNEQFPFSGYINELIKDEEKVDIKNYFLKEKLLNTYQDALYFNLNENDLKYLLHKEVREVYDIPKMDDKISIDILKRLFLNKDIQSKLENYNPLSEFFLVMKSIYKDLNTLLLYVQNNQSYLAVKKYKEILSFINKECLSDNLTDKEKKEELEKRYSNYGVSDQLRNYKVRMNKSQYNNKSYADITFIQKKNYSRICNILQKFLLEIMFEFYKKTGFFYRQIDDKCGYFILDDINFVVYNYDDDMNMYYDGNSLKDYEFWAEIFNKDFNPNKITFNLDSNYIEHTENEVYYLPYECMDEAYIKAVNGPCYDGMTDNIYALEKFNSIGFPSYVINNEKLLLRERIFYKDPRIVDELNISDTYKYPTLNKLLLCKNKEEREYYIKKLIQKYKGDLTKTSNRKKEISDKMKEDFKAFCKSVDSKNARKRRNYID